MSRFKFSHVYKFGYYVPVTNRCPARTTRKFTLIPYLLRLTFMILCDEPSGHPGPHHSQVPDKTWENNG